MSLTVMDAAAPRLVLEGVTIRRGRDLVLSELSWNVLHGSIAWVVGDNGAGKSSLLRVLAGLAAPAAGRIRRLPAGEAAARGQSVYYHPGMRAPGDVLIGHWRRLICALRPACQPGPLDPGALPARRRLRALSTGEAKRLLLDALLCAPARFTILDEPYEHLSPAAKGRLTALLAERARAGVVVVATNQPVPAGEAGPVLRLDLREPELAGGEA